MERKARSEWSSIDLEFAVELTTTLVQLRREQKLLKDEEMVIPTKAGVTANPRIGVVAGLQRRAMFLGSYLRINPGSDRASHPDQLRGQRAAEASAREALNDEHFLLATVRQ